MKLLKVLKNDSKKFKVTVINTNGNGHWDFEVLAASEQEARRLAAKKTHNTIVKVKQIDAAMQITASKKGNWDVGAVKTENGVYTFQLLRFDEPSQFGINKGKISKLHITGPDKRVVASFDRGWSKMPVDDMTDDVYDVIMRKFGR